MTQLDRRTFLRGGLAVTGSALASATALQTLAAHAAWAASGRPAGLAEGYGPLFRTAARNTGEELLALPRGFTYVVVSQTGQIMSDGNPTPIAFDGMAAFPGPDGLVRLIRNHEVRTDPNSPVGRVLGPVETMYDPSGVGGTTTLDVSIHGIHSAKADHFLVRHFVSLNGTIINCAGGIMLDQFGWVTCEETVEGPADGWEKKHGYCFIVPLFGPEPGHPAVAEPIPAMGRFSHEAIAVDPRTGFVYETEDHSNQPDGFFRYRPNDPEDLRHGGVLEMLKVKGVDNYDTREGEAVGDEIAVEWVVIEDPDPDLEGGATTVTEQGLAKGGAIFNRLEGCWWGHKSVIFNSTSGGDTKSGDVNTDGYREGYGQVWRHVPDASGGFLQLVYESPGPDALDSPDNLTVTPRGGILLCEDDASDADGDTHPLAPDLENVNRLIGLDRGGLPFEFAVNIANTSEFAGACFSPDGKVLFVNNFGAADSEDPPGRTFAITGPWRRGPL
jgi:secreted PhoX family phosphatase